VRGDTDVGFVNRGKNGWRELGDYRCSEHLIPQRGSKSYARQPRRSERQQAPTTASAPAGKNAQIQDAAENTLPLNIFAFPISAGILNPKQNPPKHSVYN